MKFRISTLLKPFRALRNPTFGRLYAAQTVSLLGDAFTWVGLALLAYEIDPEGSPVILATALTLRVFAFIIFSPFAGVLADRVPRKRILYLTHFCRMAIVACLPFVTGEWQIYLLVFLLNVFNAFFTPTYRAIIPQITEGKYYREAVGLSVATYQVLGVLGPGLAGIMSVWFGAREIFVADAVTFVVAGILILTIPATELQRGVSAESRTRSTRSEVGKGIRLLFSNRILRFALSIEFVASLAGAQILVNTIAHVKTDLRLEDSDYGLVMAVFGVGAAVAAFAAGILDKSTGRRVSLLVGVFLLGGAVTLANFTGFYGLLVLWVLAGLGQSLAEMPSETLIGEQIATKDQGKVYGSHFAFSHLWWAIAYPIAGFVGTNYPENDFLYTGLLSLTIGVLLLLLFLIRKSAGDELSQPHTIKPTNE